MARGKMIDRVQVHESCGVRGGLRLRNKGLDHQSRIMAS
jgi:hypothetical protein